MKVQEVYYIYFIYKDIHYFFAILHCTAYRQSCLSGWRSVTVHYK
jgi:hypothetical protein